MHEQGFYPTCWYSPIHGTEMSSIDRYFRFLGRKGGPSVLSDRQCLSHGPSKSFKMTWIFCNQVLWYYSQWHNKRSTAPHGVYNGNIIIELPQSRGGYAPLLDCSVVHCLFLMLMIKRMLQLFWCDHGPGDTASSSEFKSMEAKDWLFLRIGKFEGLIQGRQISWTRKLKTFQAALTARIPNDCKTISTLSCIWLFDQIVQGRRGTKQIWWACLADIYSRWAYLVIFVIVDCNPSGLSLVASNLLLTGDFLENVLSGCLSASLELKWGGCSSNSFYTSKHAIWDKFGTNYPNMLRTPDKDFIILTLVWLLEITNKRHWHIGTSYQLWIR